MAASGSQHYNQQNASNKFNKARLSEPFALHNTVDTTKLREQGATPEPRRSQSSQPTVPPSFNRPAPPLSAQQQARFFLQRSLSYRGRGSRMMDCAAHMLTCIYSHTRSSTRRMSFTWQQMEPPHFSRDESHLIRALWPADQTELFSLSRKLIENIFVAVPQTKKLFGADQADSLEQWFKSKQFRQHALALVHIMTRTVTIYTMVGGSNQESDRQQFESRLRQFGKHMVDTHVPFRDDDWVSVACTITETVIEFARHRSMSTSVSSAISSHQQQQIDLTAELWRRLVEYVVAVMRNGWLQKTNPRRRFSLGANTVNSQNAAGGNPPDSNVDNNYNQSNQYNLFAFELCDRLVTI